MSSVVQKAVSTEMLKRPDKLYSFLNAATKSSTTDPDLGLTEMATVAKSLQDVGAENIQFVTVPTTVYQPDPNRVQWTDDADLIWEAIRGDHAIGAAPTASPSPTGTESPAALTVTPDKIAVQVLNGSGVRGLAAQAVEALQVQGFRQVTRGDAPAQTTGVLVGLPDAGGRCAHRRRGLPGRCHASGVQPGQHRRRHSRCRCPGRRRGAQPAGHAAIADAEHQFFTDQLVEPVDLRHDIAEPQPQPQHLDPVGGREHLLLTPRRSPRAVRTQVVRTDGRRASAGGQHQRQEGSLAIEPTGIPCEGAVRPDDPMAGHEDAHGVVPHGLTDALGQVAVAEFGRDDAVRRRRAVGDPRPSGPKPARRRRRHGCGPVS